MVMIIRYRLLQLTETSPKTAAAPALSRRPPAINPPRLTVVEDPTTHIGPTDSPCCTSKEAQQMTRANN